MSTVGHTALLMRGRGHVEEPDGAGDENLHFTIASDLTLRDYFAAKAIMLAYSEAIRTSEDDWNYEELAEAAYDMADAMLKEREK